MAREACGACSGRAWEIEEEALSGGENNEAHMEKLLNIGAPYIGLNGGDKERARFQLDALRAAYAVHNLLVARPEELSATMPAHEAAGPALGIPGLAAASSRVDS